MPSIWPSETALLVKAGTCLVPMATGLLIAEGMALRTRMFGTAKLWAWLAGVLLGLVILCMLAGIICWICFSKGSNPLF
ncbi:MAG: hypothetical protein K8S55_08975 [Phycisphaerae bacterium]|nr:hypothetical protein [Phycisphaerae bacterium]